MTKVVKVIWMKVNPINSVEGKESKLKEMLKIHRLIK